MKSYFSLSIAPDKRNSPAGSSSNNAQASLSSAKAKSDLADSEVQNVKLEGTPRVTCGKGRKRRAKGRLGGRRHCAGSIGLA